MTGRIGGLWNRRTLLAAAMALILITGLAVFGHGLSKERQWWAEDGNVGSIAYSADGKTLMAASQDSVRLWDPSTGTLKANLTTYDAGPGAMVTSPAGDLLACTRYRRVSKHEEEYSLELWDLRTNTRVAAVKDAKIRLIRFTPDGKSLLTLGPPEAPTLQYWSLPTLQPGAALPSRPAATMALCFSPDGKTFISSEANAVALIDAKTGTSLRTMTAPPGTLQMLCTFCDDGKAVAALVSMQTHSGLWVWDASSGKVIRSFEFDHQVHEASFSADGSRVAILMTWYVFSRSDRPEVWDVTRGKKIGSITQDQYMWSIAMSPDGQHVAIGFQQKHYRDKGPIGVWRVR